MLGKRMVPEKGVEPSRDKVPADFESALLTQDCPETTVFPYKTPFSFTVGYTHLLYIEHN
jgi:hypothetical protein